VFSSQMVTNLLNVLPTTLLVGLKVKAVARAFATAEAAVEVYWVCASAPVRVVRRMRRYMMEIVEFLSANQTLTILCVELSVSYYI
jgi:hypothetical protein